MEHPGEQNLRPAEVTLRAPVNCESKFYAQVAWNSSLVLETHVSYVSMSFYRKTLLLQHGLSEFTQNGRRSNPILDNELGLKLNIDRHSS